MLWSFCIFLLLLLLVLSKVKNKPKKCNFLITHTRTYSLHVFSLSNIYFLRFVFHIHENSKIITRFQTSSCLKKNNPTLTKHFHFKIHLTLLFNRCLLVNRLTRILVYFWVTLTKRKQFLRVFFFAPRLYFY